MAEETVCVLKRDGNGRVVAAGPAGRYSVVARFTSGGPLDSSFGSGGKVFVDFVGGYDVGHAVAMSGDKILISGLADMMGDSNMGVASLNSDGSADTSFGNNGVVSLDLGSWDDEATTMVTDSNGNLLVGGFTVNPN